MTKQLRARQTGPPSPSSAIRLGISSPRIRGRDRQPTLNLLNLAGAITCSYLRRIPARATCDETLIAGVIDDDPRSVFDPKKSKTSPDYFRSRPVNVVSLITFGYASFRIQPNI
jgi:hypothetical protein